MAGSDVLNVSFHGIGAPGRELEPGEDPYWVDTERFLRILDEIATWPSVRLSFDDGNASDLRVAAPALADRGLTAQFFPLAGRPMLSMMVSIGGSMVCAIRGWCVPL